MANPVIDETGNVYDKLTVIGRSKDNTIEGKARWLCQCVCGSVRIAVGTELRQGKMKACWDCTHDEGVRKRALHRESLVVQTST